MAGLNVEAKSFRYDWTEVLTGSDMEQLRELFNAVLETETVIGFPGPLRGEEGQAFFEGLALDVKLARKQLLLVRHPEGQVVGMVLLSQNSQPNCRHLAEVSKCIIHPQYRGQGILDVGLGALRERCQALGLDVLLLDVRKGSRAELIWRQLGFVPFGELSDYARVNGRVEAGVYMSARISELGRGRPHP